MTEPIVANSVLPAIREPLHLRTSDGLSLVGELARPATADPVATIVTVHPLPTHGGMMDSHVLRKMAWRLPASGTCTKWSGKITPSSAASARNGNPTARSVEASASRTGRRNSTARSR